MIPKKRRKGLWIAATLVLLLCCAGAAGWFFFKGKAKPLDEALICSVKKGDLAIEVLETGKIAPREKVEVKSKVAGQVERVFVQEGAKVKRGQPLLRLDPTDYQREVARAEAEVEQAENARHFAQMTYERKKKGLEERAVAQAELDLSESEVKARSAALKLAEVALAAARDRLRYTEILSPMDGTLTERGIQPGEVVTPGVQATFEGKPLLTVADLSTLIIKTELNQIDVAKVKKGQKVTLNLDALPGKTFTAKVTQIAPASQTPKGKEVDVFPVEAVLDKADHDIKPGMTADVRIHIDVKPQILILPLEAVIKEKGKEFAMKVIAPEKGKKGLEKTEVKTGLKNEREVEIVSGLREGDKVLIDPASAEKNEYKL